MTNLLTQAPLSDDLTLTFLLTHIQTVSEYYPFQSWKKEVYQAYQNFHQSARTSSSNRSFLQDLLEKNSTPVFYLINRYGRQGFFHNFIVSTSSEQIVTLCKILTTFSKRVTALTEQSFNQSLWIQLKEDDEVLTSSLSPSFFSDLQDLTQISISQLTNLQVRHSFFSPHLMSSYDPKINTLDKKIDQDLQSALQFHPTLKRPHMIWDHRSPLEKAFFVLNKFLTKTIALNRCLVAASPELSLVFDRFILSIPQPQSQDDSLSSIWSLKKEISRVYYKQAMDTVLLQLPGYLDSFLQSTKEAIRGSSAPLHDGLSSGQKKRLFDLFFKKGIRHNRIEEIWILLMKKTNANKMSLNDWLNSELSSIAPEIDREIFDWIKSCHIKDEWNFSQASTKETYTASLNTDSLNPDREP